MATYWEIAAHSAYDMFSKYKYLIVNLVFPTSVFSSGNFFLIAPFPDLIGLSILIVNICSITGQKKIEVSAYIDLQQP